MAMLVMTDRELRSFIDQKLCEIADALMHYYNPCEIQGSGCLAGKPNPCCLDTSQASGMCQFWMNDRCQFSNCDCKLWLCNTAAQYADPDCVSALKALESFARIFDLVKKPLIGDPYTGVDMKPDA